MANVYILVKMKRTEKVKITVLFNSQLFTDLIFLNFSLNKLVQLQKYPVYRPQNFEQMVESCFSSICSPITTKVGIMVFCHKISQKQ